MKQFFEDCEVGDAAASDGRTITEADVVAFASLSGDWNPVHCDAALMSQHPLGERIAHGLLILSVASGSLYRMAGYEILPRQEVIFSGLEKTRFVTAVKLGDTVTTHVETIEKSELNAQLGIIVVRMRVLNQAEELVMSTRLKFALPRRSAAESKPAAEGKHG